MEPGKNNQRDFEGVKKEVFQQLELLNHDLFYHGRSHTFEDVIPTAEMLGKLEKLSEDELVLVKTAALFHDTGFLDQYDKNEPFGVKRARELLPKYGYSGEDLQIIEKCIMATQLPQNPDNFLLAEIICDADLGHLGTDTFFLKSEALRLELNRVKKLNIGVKQWHTSNIKFLQNHKYFTKSAIELFQSKKDENQKETIQLVSL